MVKVLRLCLEDNRRAAEVVFVYVRTILTTDVATAGLLRHGTGRWGMALTMLIAAGLTLGLSVVLVVGRIHSGTEALPGLLARVAAAGR